MPIDNPEAQVLRDKFVKYDHEIEQALGNALGYPEYSKDQKNFPGATKTDGVCVGEHVSVTLVKEAATLIRALIENPESLISEEPPRCSMGPRAHKIPMKGMCHILSKGDKCPCILCTLDRSRDWHKLRKRVDDMEQELVDLP